MSESVYTRLFDLGNTTKAIGMGMVVLGTGGAFASLMLPKITALVVPSLLVVTGGAATMVAGQNIQNASSDELQRLRAKQLRAIQTSNATPAAVQGLPMGGAYW